MNENFKYEAYKKKLQGLCDEHGFVFRLRNDKYPITLTIKPAQGLDNQMSLLEREDEHSYISANASLTLMMMDGEITQRTDEVFTVEDVLLTKIKNLFRNLCNTWMAFFFRDVMERDLLHGRAKPVIDESEADDLDDDEELDEDEEDTEDDEGEDGDPGDGEPIDPSTPMDEAEIETATRIVRQVNKASVGLLQRQMKIGYAKAARLMDVLEERGVVGSFDGSKPREVLPYDEPDDGTDDTDTEEGDDDADAADEA